VTPQQWGDLVRNDADPGAPGGSQSLGFQGTWTASDTSPSSFALNGTTCG
jgi:Cellulose binding domain